MDDVGLIKNILRRIESLENVDDEEGEIENSASLIDSINGPKVNDRVTFTRYQYTLICGDFLCGGDSIL